METKIKTLEQIHAAQDVIINAMANPDLTPTETKILQDSSSKLRDMERSIVGLIGQTLVDKLIMDSSDLKNLIEEIKTSADKLAEVASVIEKAAGAIELFLNIIDSAKSVG